MAQDVWLSSPEVGSSRNSRSSGRADNSTPIVKRFSALLRQPARYSRQEKLDYVNEVIKLVDLDDCARMQVQILLRNISSPALERGISQLPVN
jgi:hypothetical protein